MSAIPLPSLWRADLPTFSAFVAEGLTYLDSAATTRKPQAVLDALNGYYLGGAANVHCAQHVPGEHATRAFEAMRSRVVHWLHAVNPAEVPFARGTTEAINLMGYGLERHFRPGDELLVSVLEHHVSLLPWQQLALHRGLVLRVLPLDKRGVIGLEQVRHIIGERTHLLTISQLSSVLGTWQPVVELIQLTREYGAWILVDGVQGSVHGRHDLPGLGCDSYIFSGHKLYGPDGIGVLWGRPQALEQLAHWQFGGEMVRHTDFHEASFHAALLGFEAGTPAASAAIGLDATVDWLAIPDEVEVATHEGALHARLLAGLLVRGGVSLFDEPQAALASFCVDGVYVADLAHLLGERGIAARAGHYCVMPLLQRLEVPGVLCASLGLYNDADDLERFFLALDRSPELLR